MIFNIKTDNSLHKSQMISVSLDLSDDDVILQTTQMILFELHCKVVMHDQSLHIEVMRPIVKKQNDPAFNIV